MPFYTVSLTIDVEADSEDDAREQFIEYLVSVSGFESEVIERTEI